MNFNSTHTCSYAQASKCAIFCCVCFCFVFFCFGKITFYATLAVSILLFMSAYISATNQKYFYLAGCKGNVSLLIWSTMPELTMPELTILPVFARQAT